MHGHNFSPEFDRHEIARGGAYLPTCRSAFEAEVVALDLAVQDFLEHIS